MLLRNKHGHGGTTSVMDPEYYKNLFQNIIKGQENPKFKNLLLKLVQKKMFKIQSITPKLLLINTLKTISTVIDLLV